MEYQPGKAKETSTASSSCRKNISVENGEDGMFDQLRYFFLRDERRLSSEMSATDVIFHSNARCNQENIIKQLKNGVPAMRMPAGDLNANWAYMVIAIIAWNLKAWLAMMLPKRAGAARLAKMEFRTFLKNVMMIPAQIKLGARKTTSDCSATTRGHDCSWKARYDSNNRRPERADLVLICPEARLRTREMSARTMLVAMRRTSNRGNTAEGSKEGQKTGANELGSRRAYFGASCGRD